LTDGIWIENSKTSSIESKISILKYIEVEGDIEMEKYDDDGDGWDVPTFLSENVSNFTYEETGSCRSTGGRSDDEGSGSGSPLRLSRLGCTTRGQFLSILGEFWGKLFDFHGQLIELARLKDLTWPYG
jgi:hypothetical protein